jgi:hypothetical protein
MRPQLNPFDRRKNKRYAVDLPLRFSYSNQGSTLTGTGTVTDLSRCGICFQCENPPPDNIEIEVRVAWPMLLDNSCPLDLVVRGRVARTTARGTVVRMHNYEFKTRSSRAPAPQQRPREDLVADANPISHCGRIQS